VVRRDKGGRTLVAWVRVERSWSPSVSARRSSRLHLRALARTYYSSTHSPPSSTPTLQALSPRTSAWGTSIPRIGPEKRASWGVRHQSVLPTVCIERGGQGGGLSAREPFPLGRAPETPTTDRVG
jgi:hypothetical protein